MKLLYVVCFLTQFILSLSAMVSIPVDGIACVRCAGPEDYKLLGAHTKMVFCFDASDKTVDAIVARAPYLEKLRFMITNNTITDSTLVKIAQLKNLKTLSFFPPSSIDIAAWEKNNVVTDQGFSALASLTSLQKFALFGFCNISNSIGRVIGQWRALEHLRLCCCLDLTDAMLVYLTRLSSLKQLFWYPSISNAGLQCVAHLKQLQVLVLANCSALTSEGFGYLRALSLLKSLTMCEVNALNDRDMQMLTELHQLEIFDCTADNSALHDQGIALLKKCHKLKMINLVGFRALSDDSLKLCLDIASLKKLRIVGSSEVTFDALLELYSNGTDVDVYIEPADFIAARECSCSTNF